MNRIRALLALAAFLLAVVRIAPADTDSMKQRARDAAATSRAAGDAVRKGANGAVDGAGASGADDSGASTEGPASTDEAPGHGAWSAYEFVPGERTLFVEDFSNDSVGAAAHRFETREGSADVVALDGAHALRSADGERLVIRLAEQLPKRFTVELTYRGDDNGAFRFDTNADGPATPGACTFGAYRSSAFVDCSGLATQRSFAFPAARSLGHARFSVNGYALRAWIENVELVNAPATLLPRTQVIALTLPAGSLLASLRIAAVGERLEDRLGAATAAVASGIVFDSGSDRVRPESTPAMVAIRDLLKHHPTLRLAIESHTDEGGDAAAGLALTQRRAAAVRDCLVSRFGVDGERLESRGWGGTRPRSSGTTPEARMDNCRIEVVRL
jgi:OOP family OmpA-OmpF porin